MRSSLWLWPSLPVPQVGCVVVWSIELFLGADLKLLLLLAIAEAGHGVEQSDMSEFGCTDSELATDIDDGCDGDADLQIQPTSLQEIQELDNQWQAFQDDPV
jgi:hypothetical protein